MGNVPARLALAIALLATAPVLGQEASAPIAQTGFARLEGHGGPVRGITSDTGVGLILSASFDNSVGVWRAEDLSHVVWLDDHDAAVNAAIMLGDGGFATAGDDFSLRLWTADGTLRKTLTGHQGKILGLARKEDLIATASWDGSIGLWREGADPVFLTGHRQGVNAVAFAEDGRVLYSASIDGTIRVWDAGSGAPQRLVASHGFGVNTLLIDEAAGWLAYGALDGGVRILDLDSDAEIADVTSGRLPVLGLARSPDGSKLAISDGEGHIHVVSTRDWTTLRDFRAVPRGPVWALAFHPDGKRVLAGSILDSVDVWPIESADTLDEAEGPIRDFHRAPETMMNGERQFMRKCSICHTLDSTSARRAGPTLRGIFGRQAGTLDSYVYSDALSESDLVWNAESLDKLFDIGPAYYTPGSKMPMQRIVRAEDRDDLIEYLRKATAPAPRTQDTDP